MPTETNLETSDSHNTSKEVPVVGRTHFNSSILRLANPRYLSSVKGDGGAGESSQKGTERENYPTAASTSESLGRTIAWKEIERNNPWLGGQWSPPLLRRKTNLGDLRVGADPESAAEMNRSQNSSVVSKNSPDWMPRCPHCSRPNAEGHTMCDPVLPRICQNARSQPENGGAKKDQREGKSDASEYDEDFVFWTPTWP